MLVHHTRRVLYQSFGSSLERERPTRRSAISMDSQRHSKSHDVVRHFNLKGDRLSFRLFVQSRLFFFPMHLNLDVPLTVVPSQLTTNPILLEPSLTLLLTLPLSFCLTSHVLAKTSRFLQHSRYFAVVNRFFLFLQLAALFMDNKADKAGRQAE